MNPLGGTELQYALLHKYVDNTLLKNFQITTSVPEKIPLAKNKINILWEQNSYDQSNIVPWMKDKANHLKYDWYVFNSIGALKNTVCFLDYHHINAPSLKMQ
jgi:hypothetical protein